MSILFLLLSLLLLCLFAYTAGWLLRRRRPSEAEAAPSEPASRPRPQGCCGQHEVCEKESLLAAVSREVEYFEDEELDAFRGRPSDAYRPSEVEQREDEVAAWVRSLQLRGVNLPDELKDQVLLIVGEMRQQETP